MYIFEGKKQYVTIFLTFFMISSVSCLNGHVIIKSFKDTLTDNAIADLYRLYNEALKVQNNPPTRRMQSNRHVLQHIKKLQEVNALKQHNLDNQGVKPENLVYIKNPVEARIPHAFLTVEEFKSRLRERANALRQKDLYSNAQATTKRKLKKFINKSPVLTRIKFININATKFRHLSTTRPRQVRSKYNTKQRLRAVSTTKITPTMEKIPTMKLTSTSKIASTKKAASTTTKPITTLEPTLKTSSTTKIKPTPKRFPIKVAPITKRISTTATVPTTTTVPSISSTITTVPNTTKPSTTPPTTTTETTTKKATESPTQTTIESAPKTTEETTTEPTTEPTTQTTTETTTQTTTESTSQTTPKTIESTTEVLPEETTEADPDIVQRAADETVPANETVPADDTQNPVSDVPETAQTIEEMPVAEPVANLADPIAEAIAEMPVTDDENNPVITESTVTDTAVSESPETVPDTTKYSPKRTTSTETNADIPMQKALRTRRVLRSRKVPTTTKRLPRGKPLVYMGED